MKQRKNRAALLMLPMALVAILLVLAPLVYIILLSFATRDEVFGVTWQWTLASYARLGNPMYFRVLLDSLVLGVMTTAITLLVGYPFAYCMARLKPRTRAIVMLLLVVPSWTNALVRLYGWRTFLQYNGPLNQFLTWSGIAQEPLRMMFNDGAVLLGMLYALLPFMILPIYSSVEKMDWSMVEASRDLGAGSARTFLRITLPLTFSGIMAGCILVFVPSMGLFFIPEMFGGGNAVLMGNLIRDQIFKARDWAFGAALSVVMLATTTLLLTLYRKLTGGHDLGVFS